MLENRRKFRNLGALGASVLMFFAWGCVEDERRKREEIPDYLCDSDRCSNGGGCRKVGDESVCVCAPGFSGDRCEQVVSNDVKKPVFIGQLELQSALFRR